jgi:hypothetical protein
MRSELVSSAVMHVSNRYLLVSLASRATRALHRPNSRVQDTVNDAIQMLGHRGTPTNLVAWPAQPALAAERGGLLRTA